MRWPPSAESFQIRANAVTRELKKANETTRVNGAARKGKIEETVNVGIPPIIHSTPESKHVGGAGLNNTWMGALASAVLAIEKERRIQDHAASDTLRRGKLVENGLVYRQTFVIRSYEAGFDKIASIETIANLFQETALNHVGLSKFVGDGMGTTHAMMRHRLIWVVTRMHVEVDRYPVW